MVSLIRSQKLYKKSQIIQSIYTLIILTLWSVISSQAWAVELPTEGEWELVASSSIVQSDRVYARGVGYYTDNTIAISGGNELSSNLRLVVSNSNLPVTNADGQDADGNDYFNIISINDSTRIFFQRKRARFGYSAQLQQLVIPIILDIDDDGVLDSDDNCPTDQNPDQADFDQDLIGDVCDPDIDGDFVNNNLDNCPMLSNEGQENLDEDADGDACDIDIDGDLVNNNVDNCPMEAGSNPDGCNAILLCPADDQNCITITGLIFGNGASLNNAAITIGTNSVDTTSSLDGSFSADIGAAELANDGIDDFFPVKVVANGFASGYAKVVLVQGTLAYEISLNLQQVSDTITEDDDITEGVELIKNGAPVGQLTIPQAALPEGVTSVTGAITYLDPETDDILATPGGDLLALPEGADPNEDSPVQLETFGMMEFDLVDQNGDAITELGGNAEVCMKAPSGLSLGDTIPLWYYDETDGLWKEEGQGSVEDRDGQLMICGAVSHFSWWNYDQPITTHACLKFSIEPENDTPALTGLNWYSEGVTYSGTSPSRQCSNNTGTFDSLTVKRTTDSDNPEQIRVYTLLGGTKFYLLADGDATYSLTQEQDSALVFDTPAINGSCLNNTETGNCQPLDYMDVNPDGILPLSTNVNLPPVITEFGFDRNTLFASESMAVRATVTDPEGTAVSLSWTTQCGFYGNGNGSESITTDTTSGASGVLYSAIFNAPISLNYPVESCLIALEATDDDGIMARAERWIIVAASFEYELTGTLYGTDGLPMPNAPVDYVNWECNLGEGLNQTVTTDDNGQYSLAINLASCEIDEGQEGLYFDLGYLEVEFEYDGNVWRNTSYISNYNELFTLQCEILSEGSTLCNHDIHLPTLWAPINGNVYPSDESDFTNMSLHVNSWQSSYNSYSYLYQPIDIDISIAYGPVMVPLGELSLYFTDGVNNYFNNQRLLSLAGDVLDVGNATAPLTVTVFDGLGGFLSGINVNLSNQASNSNVAGTTDGSGEFSASMLLGQYSIRVDTPEQSYNHWDSINVKDQPTFVDVNSSDTCSISGTMFDIFGQPHVNKILRYISNGLGQYEDGLFFTDGEGKFSFEVSPGSLNVLGENYEWGGNYQVISNCRSADANPRQIQWDLIYNTSENFNVLD